MRELDRRRPSPDADRLHVAVEVAGGDLKVSCVPSLMCTQSVCPSARVHLLVDVDDGLHEVLARREPASGTG